MVEGVKYGNWWLPLDEKDSEDAGGIHFLNQEGPQLEILEAALKYVKNWNTAIDGGAHVGSYTVPFLKKFINVIAFEPVLQNYMCLLANLYTHGVSKGYKGKLPPVLFLAGLSDKFSGQKFFRPKHLTKGTMSMSCYTSPAKPGLVPIISIDSLDLKNVGLIKLDIEGYESLAIKGAEKTIRRCKPVLLIEWKEEYKVIRKKTDTSPLKKTQGWPLPVLHEKILDMGLELKEECEKDRVYGPKD